LTEQRRGLVDLGFETIGNATLICHDRKPVLVTDPWLGGDVFFGSWTFSHHIPQEQLDAITGAEYAWVSHGHPDHLSLRGLRKLRAKRILLSDHVGGRIASILKEKGWDVAVLRDRTWYTLSDRIRVLSISDYNQDGVLLVDLDGRLLVNLNDASDRGWGGFVRSVIRRYPVSILMRLSGFGDADMINIFDEEGRRIPPPAAKREPVGKQIAGMTREFGATHFLPFSSMHRYQRADSIWADEYTTRLSDYLVGFDSTTSTLLPAFIRYDRRTEQFEEIHPPERQAKVRHPEEFGDDWSDELGAEDFRTVSEYFRSISHLERHFKFINLRVGGRDNVITLANRKFDRGITFEVPRTSLMHAVSLDILDDLLIGNFMKTILHGKTSPGGLYPHFTPYVAKYADSGGARTKEELRQYFLAYLRRAPFEFLRDQLERRSRDVVRSVLQTDSGLYRMTRRAYHLIKGW